MSQLFTNMVTHHREKPGVAVHFQVSTIDPLPADLYHRIEIMATSINLLFDAIPEPEAVES